MFCQGFLEPFGLQSRSRSHSWILRTKVQKMVGVIFEPNLNWHKDVLIGCALPNNICQSLIRIQLDAIPNMATNCTWTVFELSCLVLTATTGLRLNWKVRHLMLIVLRDLPFFSCRLV